MIRTQREYEDAKLKVETEREALDKQRALLAEKGFSSAEVSALLEPTECFYLELKEEVDTYERMRQGDFRTVSSLKAVGQQLIGMRIAMGWSQRDLADKLGCNPSQVSRDERNEYHGISLSRADAIVKVFEEHFQIEISVAPKSGPTPLAAE